MWKEIWSFWAENTPTLARSDVVSALNVGLRDPHRELADRLLNHIPRHRADHSVYFIARYSELPTGVSLLANVAGDDHHLQASDIVGAFNPI